MTLDDVSDIESIRKVAKLLEAENQRLAREVAKLHREMHELRGGDPEQLALKLAGLEGQLATLRQKIFGDSSEKRPRNKTNGDDTKEPQRGHGPKGQPKLAIVEQVHVADEADKVCGACGGHLDTWTEQFEEAEEIDVIERRFVITKHKRQKYRCRCGQCIETALGPVKLFAGARYSPKFAITVAVDKYTDHMPLERQVRAMARDGLDTDSQTLWDQLNALSRVLEPVHTRLHAHVLSQPVIGADETTWRLMGAEGKRQGGVGKKWQVWAIAAADAVSYRILDSRSAAAAGEVLAGYKGTVLCDGYSAYESLRKQMGGFRLAHCWAHVRRKFVEIEDQHPDQCGEVLNLIGQLYEVERHAQTGPPGERRALRNEKSKPILKQIQAWALATPALPQSGLGKAIAYMGGIWNGLQVFLDDPNVAIDNNGTERALRGVVLGRKNHYGSRSQRGTEVAALFYSLIETAKLVGIGPQTYLQTATNAALRGAVVPLPHELV
ncbi:MAG TPA: IS66 family transposase [Polyangiaceae bacterium]|nr:IS66 family transposase [Polyangiaceae bacterium]